MYPFTTRLRPAPGLSLLLGVALLGLSTGCGSGDEGGESVSSEPVAGRGAREPKLVEAQDALERGMADVARTLFAQLGGDIGLDRLLLEARLHHAERDDVAAMRLLERAKEEAPNDGRVWAAESELFAGLGRLSGAEASIREGWKRCGRTAELERAQGILLLATPGGGGLGLLHLEKAREMDPNLPYLARPLALAHILAGRMDIAGGAPESAYEHARAALAWDSSNVDARELRAEAATGLFRFEEALEIYAELESRGRDLGATRALLHRQAATAFLLAERRDKAVEHYRAARKLGLDDAGLGFGVSVLAGEAAVHVDKGVAAYDDGELELARSEFTEALAIDPRAARARNHLGVVLFRLARYEEAAAAWEEVLAEAKRAGGALPEPVHLNLARAWRLAGRTDLGRKVLSDYLDAEPKGVWVEKTRDLLFHLEEAEFFAERDD